jgi:Ribonucleotide reductase, alpha subunit
VKSLPPNDCRAALPTVKQSFEALTALTLTNCSRCRRGFFFTPSTWQQTQIRLFYKSYPRLAWQGAETARQAFQQQQAADAFSAAAGKTTEHSLLFFDLRQAIQTFYLRACFTMSNDSVSAGLPAMPARLEKVRLNPNAGIVLEKRYFKKDADGSSLEEGRELFWRVAAAIASEESKYAGSPYKTDQLAKEFYDLMTSWKFLPNSPTLMNAGTALGQLSACFVLPVGDSIEEIFDAVKHAAMIHKSGGGTGFCLFPHPPQRQPGGFYRRRGFRPLVVSAHIQHRHRANQAGRHAARRQHGHHARGPSGYHGLHQG